VADDDFENMTLKIAVPHPDVVFTDLDGLEGVLVDLNTRKYYQLNETASFVWRGIEQKMSPENIAKEMTERYDVSAEHAASSVRTILRRFYGCRLIHNRDTFQKEVIDARWPT
jgi:hypothetical protein